MEDRTKQLSNVLSQAFSSGQGGLDEATLQAIQEHLRWVHLRGKEVLFHKGDASDSLYIGVNGRLRAVGYDQFGNEMVREIAQGEVLGEMGVISDEPRSMTVYAVRDSDLVMLPKSAFEGLMSRHPQMMMGILQTLILRLRREPFASPGPTASSAIAVVPLGSEAPVGEFAGRLTAALEALGPTVLLDRQIVDERLGTPGVADVSPEAPEGGRLVAWLNEQEVAHRFLVYRADIEPSGWTRRCIRQADHVLLVAMASGDPEPSDVERELIWEEDGETSAQRSLALLHQDGRRLPTGTARWLGPRRLYRHYQVRRDRSEDFGRVARSLAERGVSLVLGGGGARAFSQIGVIRALRECGIPIDFVGGTSMGAIVAAACAMGWDHATMVRLGREAFVESEAFSEYTLPVISLIRGRRLDRVNQMMFGDTQIEDLWIPQFSVSCNLTTSELVVHRRGALWKGVRASGSLPGVLAPVLDDGDLLVDGGVLNNLPGDVMREISGGPMILVDVTPKRDLRAECDSMPSPWRMIWKRLKSGRGGAGMPGILNIMMRTTMLSSIRLAKEVKRDAALYLHPPVGSYGMLQFDAIDQIVETGYQYAMRQIELLDGRKALCGPLAFEKSS